MGLLTKEQYSDWGGGGGVCVESKLSMTTTKMLFNLLVCGTYVNRERLAMCIDSHCSMFLHS